MSDVLKTRESEVVIPRPGACCCAWLQTVTYMSDICTLDGT